MFTENYRRVSPSGATYQQSFDVMLPQTTYSYRSTTAPPEKNPRDKGNITPERAFSSFFDNGHNFSTTKYLAYSTAFKLVGIPRVRLNGDSVFAPPYPNEFFNDCRASVTRLVPPGFNSTLYGNRAIAATAPTKSVADLSVFFGEFLRDGLPSAIGSTLLDPKKGSRRLKDLGGEYLNLQFGWVPLMKDLEKLLLVVKDSFKILEQYERDAGRHVRRAMSFPDVTTSEIVPATSITTRLTNSGDAASTIPDLVVTKVTRQEIRFSGAYTYYLPVGTTLMGKAARFAVLADKLLGIKLTPDKLWNLSPWSWLADWQFEIGTALQARSLLSHDNQVLQYGYLQRKTTVSKTYVHTTRLNFGQVSVPMYSQISCIKKERVRASPFGFGIDDTKISSSQWAILGALGLTLGDKQLRRSGH